MVNDKKYPSAKCTACENPVQVIGFYRRSNAPTMQDVKRQYTREQRREYKTGLGEKIKEVLLEHFDKIMYLLKREMGIRYSRTVTERMLKNYVAWEAWQYLGATLENVPWILAYMSDSQNINHQFIDADGFLHKELKKKKYGVKSKETKQSDLVQIAGFRNRYQYVAHYFTKHISKPQDGVLYESYEVVFTLVDETPENPSSTEILRRKIAFDHDYFFNLLNYGEWKPDTELLVMAKRCLSGI